MKMKIIRFDTATGEFVKEERIAINSGTDAKDIEKTINIELDQIVRQVKTLKNRAEELKAMKEALKKKAGSIDPAPVVGEV